LLLLRVKVSNPALGTFAFAFAPTVLGGMAVPANLALWFLPLRFCIFAISTFLTVFSLLAATFLPLFTFLAISTFLAFTTFAAFGGVHLHGIVILRLVGFPGGYGSVTIAVRPVRDPDFLRLQV
jgi:hypothetical protein